MADPKVAEDRNEDEGTGVDAAPATDIKDELRRSRLGLFVASRTISTFGDMAATTGLAVHVFASTNSGVALAGLFIVRILPRLFGAFAGALSDRFELRRLVIACDLVCGIFFLSMGLLQPGYLILLALVFLAEMAAVVALPASRTYVARSLSEAARARANGLLMAGTTLGFGLGSSFGGLAAGLWGHQYALLANSATFALSALLMWACRPVPPVGEMSHGRPRLISATREGVTLLVRERPLLFLTVGATMVTFCTAMDRPAVLALTERDLSGGPAAYGMTLGFVGVGGLVGALVAGRWARLKPSRAIFLLCIGIQALGHLVMGVSPLLALVVLVAGVIGVGNGVQQVCQTTLVQGATPADRVGVVMGALLSIIYLSDALGSAVGGALLDQVGSRWTFVVASIVMGLGLFTIMRAGMTRRGQNSDRITAA